MSQNVFGPYRATALWNEAILMFRDGMRLKENRHRLHKHKKSFSGRDAVSFLHDSLLTNQLFNANVTRKQAHQLLNHFLNAKFISQVKNCTMRSQDVFQDSSKYLYEFTDALVNFQVNLPVSIMNRMTHPTAPSDDNDNNSNHVKEHDKKKYQETTDEIWKCEVLKRIQNLVNLVDVNVDVNKSLPLHKIDAKWVITNGSPEWEKLKWNTELPHWILSAIHNLLTSTVPERREATYPEFEIEVFKVIVDYFDTLEGSLIFPHFYNLIHTVFFHLNSLNERSNLNVLATVSQENLMLNMSSTCEELFEAHNCISNNLPPYSCYEAAFTSDNPVTRIVPQSSYDIIHLKRSPGNNVVGSNFFGTNTNRLRATCSMHNILDVTQNPINKGVDYVSSRRRPLQVVTDNYSNLGNKFKVNNDLKKDYNKTSQPFSKKGIVNEGFASASPLKETRVYSNLSELYGNSCETRNHISADYKRKSRSFDDLDQYAYVNHGLNFTMEDPLEPESKLDYLYAIESVNKLMQASQSRRHSISSDEQSFHSACSYTDSEISHQTVYKSDYFDKGACADYDEKCQWNAMVLKKGISFFQLILMLLPPNNRAQLKMVVALMNHVSTNTNQKELSFNNMLNKMRYSIISSNKGDFIDQCMVDKIITFIAVNYELIFSELPLDVISSIKQKVFNSNKQRVSFCEQISEDQFIKQKTLESSLALSKLLETIMENDNIPKKEQKKYLKMFKECYPGIYKEHCSKMSKSSKLNKKNLRL